MSEWYDKVKGKLNGKELKSVIALFWIVAVWIAIFSLPSTFGVKKVSYFGFEIPVWLYQLRSSAMFTLNVIVALYVEDKTEEFEKVFTQIWRIKLLETNPELVISMIQDTLAAYNDLWSKIADRINRLKEREKTNIYYRNNILNKEEILDRCFLFWKRTLGGSLTLKQIIWLDWYMVYIFIISPNVMKLSAPTDFILSLQFFIILTLTNKTEGLGAFLYEVKTSLAGFTEGDSLEIVLTSLEKKIIQLSRESFLVQNIIKKVEQQLKITEKGE